MATHTPWAEQETQMRETLVAGESSCFQPQHLAGCLLGSPRSGGQTGEQRIQFQHGGGTTSIPRQAHQHTGIWPWAPSWTPPQGQTRDLLHGVGSCDNSNLRPYSVLG